MDTNSIKHQFEEIGARVKFGDLRRQVTDSGTFLRIDIKKDKKGEFFQIDSDGNLPVDILNVDAKDRHLLLLRRKFDRYRTDGSKEVLQAAKFLCGHDETHWFVAAIPETSRGVNSISAAKQALKPRDVINVERSAGLTVHKKEAHLHRNAARRRQGEWFFVPVSKNFKNIEILHNEPIRRGRGKPHMCEELVRYGGQTVMVCSRYPNGITVQEYDNMIKKDPKIKNFWWNRMTRDMEVFVRGRITHKDHKTVVLRDWHKVIPNEETKALAMRSVAFLD